MGIVDWGLGIGDWGLGKWESGKGMGKGRHHIKTTTKDPG